VITGAGIIAVLGILLAVNASETITSAEGGATSVKLGVLSQSIPLFGALFPHLVIWIGVGMFAYCMRTATLYEPQPVERWVGVGLIAVSLAARVWTAVYDFNLYERLTFIVALLGVCLVVGGLSMLRWAWAAVLFLMFMFPLPSYFEATLLMELQMWASILSTWTLQLLGVSAARLGNTISIDTLAEPLEVAQACSGLRMLTIFGAMSVAVFFIIDRPWWDRLVILLSAIPIAIVSNIIRIVTTALLFMAFGQDNETLNKIIHDWAGFAMMPVGLGLLWIELSVLSRLTTPIDAEDFAGFAPAGA
jgi:exosortase